MPVFRVHCWNEDGLCFLQPDELDLVASAPSADEAAGKLGSMITDLHWFLVSEVDDPTEAEVETIHLITQRIGAALIKRKREMERADWLKRILASSTEPVTGR